MYLFLLLGEWYGVEWDDHSRGKHNGTREGMKYFESRYECHIVVKHWNIFISSTLLKDYYVNFAVKWFSMFVTMHQKSFSSISLHKKQKK